MYSFYGETWCSGNSQEFTRKTPTWSLILRTINSYEISPLMSAHFKKKVFLVKVYRYMGISINICKINLCSKKGITLPTAYDLSRHGLLSNYKFIPVEDPIINQLHSATIAPVSIS